jgi:hypothetical protein
MIQEIIIGVLIGIVIVGIIVLKILFDVRG